MTFSNILLIVATLLFAVAVFVKDARLVPAGLAAFSASFLALAVTTD